MKNSLIICVLVILAFAFPAFAWEGKVVGVSDGDTVTVMRDGKGERIRVYGVDAPESRQAYGQRAKQFASDLVFGKTVRVERIDTDRYGRTVARIHVAGKCLSEELVRYGYAWVYSQYCKIPECRDWKALETAARSKRVGLWADPNPVPPWEYRRPATRATPEQRATGELSGNTASMVFHRATCKHFNCKNCTQRFKTREDAIKAGYRPCGLCRP